MNGLKETLKEKAKEHKLIWEALFIKHTLAHQLPSKELNIPDLLNCADLDETNYSVSADKFNQEKDVDGYSAQNLAKFQIKIKQLVLNVQKWRFLIKEDKYKEAADNFQKEAKIILQSLSMDEYNYCIKMALTIDLDLKQKIDKTGSNISDLFLKLTSVKTKIEFDIRYKKFLKEWNKMKSYFSEEDLVLYLHNTYVAS